MKKTKKILALVILLMLITTIFSNVKAAGSFSVSASSSSLTIGQTATLTITTSSCAGQFSIASSNSNVVAVSKSSTFIDGSEKITLTAKTAGTATITVTPVDVSDESYNKITGAKSVTITVKDSNNTTTQPPNTTQPPTTTTKSGDATLKSITIGSKTYSGSSLKDTISYTAGATVSSIKISATKNNSKATISGTGTKSLVAGQTNKFAITVTAENGTKKTYSVNIIRLEEESNVPNVIEGDVPTPEETKLTLTSLIIKNVELEPEFNPEVYTYVANVENMKELEIDATASKPDAQINIEGATDLKEGDNIIRITVTLGEEKAEYIVDLYNTIQDEIMGITTEDENNDNDENKITFNSKEIILIVLVVALALISIRYIIVSYKLSKEIEESTDDILMDDDEYDIFKPKNQNIVTKNEKIGRHF